MIRFWRHYYSKNTTCVLYPYRFGSVYSCFVTISSKQKEFIYFDFGLELRGLTASILFVLSFCLIFCSDNPNFPPLLSH